VDQHAAHGAAAPTAPAALAALAARPPDRPALPHAGPPPPRRDNATPASEKGVRLPQNMRVGPRIPVRGNTAMKGSKPAQLLGQLGVFLTAGPQAGYEDADIQLCLQVRKASDCL
jgi:hypothetical protein